MRETSVVATIGAFACVAAAHASVLVGPVTNPSNGHAYYLLTQNTWAASQDEAITLGGNLVTINDQAEQDWVFDYFARAGGSGRSLWIGLNAPTSSSFEWVSGETVSYTHWAAGEPNFGVERFTYMLPTLGSTPLAGFWNNDYDRTTAAYTGWNYSIPLFAIHGVVEVVPTPSGIAAMCIGASLTMRRRRR